MNIGEKGFYICYFCRFVSPFFSDKIKKLVVYFHLNESSLGFEDRKDPISTVYEKSI